MGFMLSAITFGSVSRPWKERKYCVHDIFVEAVGGGNDHMQSCMLNLQR
jgi:hypothetical protein